MATTQSNTPSLHGTVNVVPIQITAAKNLSGLTTASVHNNEDTMITGDAAKVTTSGDVLQSVTTPKPVTTMTISDVFEPPTVDYITKPIITDDSNPLCTGDMPPSDSNNVLSAPGTAVSKVSILGVYTGVFFILINSLCRYTFKIRNCNWPLNFLIILTSIKHMHIACYLCCY